MTTVIRRFILILAFASVARAAAPLAIEVYEIVPARRDSPEDARIMLKLVNTSDLTYFLRAEFFGTPDTVVERKKGDAWIGDVHLRCANSIYRTYTILPHTYFVFDEREVFYPPPKPDSRSPEQTNAELPQEDVRFRMTCYADAELTRPVEAQSRAFKAAEFVKK